MVATLQGNESMGRLADRLPPSERDFEVYRLVKVEQRSTRAAAKAAGISQTRVCQVVERVAAFLVETTPGTREEQRESRLLVAERVAVERLEFFIAEAFRSFRRSQGVQETIREIETSDETKPTATVGVTKMSFGDGRYLMLAARLSLLAAKLPAGGLGAIQPQAIPLKEECSPPAAEQGAEASKSDESADVNCSSEMTCETTAKSASSPQNGESGTVQAGSLDERERLARKAFLSAAG